MEAGKYALSSACRNGKLRTGRRKTQYHHTCMGGNCLLGSGYGICIRPERYSYHIIRETGEFVINLTTKKLAYAADYCGVKSGRDVDKFADLHLTPGKAGKLKAAPLIVESPVNLECKVTEIKELGSHHMFLAKVLAVNVDESYLDEKGKFHLNDTGLLAYSHGEYFTLGEKCGSVGYSVRKKRKK